MGKLVLIDGHSILNRAFYGAFCMDYNGWYDRRSIEFFQATVHFYKPA